MPTNKKQKKEEIAPFVIPLVTFPVKGHLGLQKNEKGLIRYFQMHLTLDYPKFLLNLTGMSMKFIGFMNTFHYGIKETGIEKKG